MSKWPWQFHQAFVLNSSIWWWNPISQYFGIDDDLVFPHDYDEYPPPDNVIPFIRYNLNDSSSDEEEEEFEFESGERNYGG